MTAPLLELRDIEVQAGGRTILSVGRLELEAATTLAVLGPNGAGKSTLLRVAAALLPPTAGTVMLDGRPASRAALREVTAAVLQRPLLRRGSVRANVETAMRFRRLPRDVMRERADAWIDRLGLGPLAERGVQSLSGGEAQRVSIARALAIEPRLMLLDEPFSGLDAPTRGELLADLRDVLSSSQTAALLVTHDRDEAAALSDRLAILQAGELRQEGPIAAVIDNPADRDCARTLGFDTILPPALSAHLLGFTAETALRAADCHVHDVTTSIGVPAILERIVPLGPSSRVTVLVEGHSVHASASVPMPTWLAGKSSGDWLRVSVQREGARQVGGGVAGRGLRTAA